MKVREAMTPEIEVLRPDSPVQEAAARMKELDVGIMPVVEAGKVYGVLTDRDIATRFVAEGLDFSGTTASDVMTRDVVFCGEDDDVEAAAALMRERGVRRLVVLDRDGQLAGIVSLGDIDDMRIRRGDKAVLDTLVKDELAAVETYKQALERLSDAPEAAELRRIENEHEEAASLLQEQIAQSGEEPATTSGVWGFWTSAVEGSAQLFGARSAIQALKMGEEREISDYERALASASVGDGVKALITGHLLPRTRAHRSILDGFLGGA